MLFQLPTILFVIGLGLLYNFFLMIYVPIWYIKSIYLISI